MFRDFCIRLKISFISLLLVLMISGLLFSQSVASEAHSKDSSRITGSVIDEITRNPVSNVNIFFEATPIGTISDQAGNFFIENAPEGRNVLVVTHIGYQEKRIQLKLDAQQIKHLNILLMPKTLRLGEVVFTASRHAETVFKSQINVAIANNEKIAVRSSPNTADALRELPGVLVQKTTAGHGAPIIRGLIGKDVLLLYNGIRLNKPTFRFGANQYMNTINVESLDRIEVTKGPGSVMYGSDAIGGVVNMISELPQISEITNGLQTSLSVRYGTADQSRIVNAAFSDLFSKMAISAGLGFKKIGDLTAGKKIGSQNPTGYDEWNGNIKCALSINQQTNLELDFLTVQQHRVPRYDKYVTGQYETYLYQPQNRYLAALTLRSRPKGTNWISSIKWNVSYQFEQEGTIQRKTDSDVLTNDKNDLITLGSYLQVNSIWQNKHVLTYGYEIYRDRVKSQRTIEKQGIIEPKRGNFPDGSTYLSWGVFLNDNLIINPKLDLTLGLRWSNMNLSAPLEPPFGGFEDNYHDLTGTIGLGYRLKYWLNLVARYAKGFRSPNFNDTVVLKVSNAGVDAPSPGLSPEKSHNFEIGVKLNQQKYSGSIFIFYNRLVDLIDRYRGTYNGLNFYDENENRVRDPDEVDIFQKRNVASAYIAGWELSGRIQLTPRWSIHGFSFWTYGQNQTDDEPMSRIPPFMVMGAIQYLPTNKISLEGFIRTATRQDRLSSRDKDDSRIPPGGTPGWTTLNFRWSSQIIVGLNMNLIFENVFDATYKEHESGIYSPGRSLVIGLRYERD
ncbi:MAG: TonB-dependent receptor [bacterium]|nr:MAG: TonB-dependent receptor [bacterium]